MPGNNKKKRSIIDIFHHSKTIKSVKRQKLNNLTRRNNQRLLSLSFSNQSNGRELDINSNSAQSRNTDNESADIEILLSPEQSGEDTQELFPRHMNEREANSLNVGDKFDHRDKFGKVFAAKVADKRGSNIYVQYEGWDSKWNIWSDYLNDVWRFYKYGSISKRKNIRFLDMKPGDMLDCNAKHQSFAGWKMAEIKQVEGGQAQLIVANQHQ